jgi:PhzF family phenazine biosynthesis protein
MGVPISVVDAFTDRPFGGNPAAVCILPEARSPRWMQEVAKEMNLSETAFLQRQADGFQLRWFTPAVEVDLCGHATLASAHVLWEADHLQPDETARFYTRSVPLAAERNGAWIELDFPAQAAEQTTPPPELLAALGVTATYVGKNRSDYLIEVEDEQSVREIRPDFRTLAQVPARGIIVTSQAASPNYDFVSRFFAPAVGIAEDPATGSSHCCLGPHWKMRLGKSELLAYQASPRGGVIRVRVAEPRVFLGGKAVTVLRGELREPWPDSAK